MRPLFVWMVLLPSIAWAVWQLEAVRPLISPLTAGLLLVILGGLAGVRLGTDSVGRFVRDIRALNKYLGEQNRDLVEMNHNLLKRVSSEQGQPQLSKSRDSGEELS